MNFIDYIFPRFCLICNLAGSYLCNKCKSFLVKERSMRRWNENIFVSSKYNKLLKKVIGKFKYNGVKALGKDLAGFLEVSVRKLKGYTLVPVPLSKRKLKQRGFNQCEVICRHLEREGFEVWDCLGRLEGERDQVGLKRRDRLKNVEGKVWVKSDYAVGGKEFVLLDDVVTTGSTLKECRKVLLEAGAREVLAVVIAGG